MKPNTPLANVMSDHLITVNRYESAENIYDIFQSNNFHHLPVIEDDGGIAGMISKEDFFRIAYLLSVKTGGATYSRKTYENLKAEEVMTKSPICLAPDDREADAISLFAANHFNALPIVDDNTLVGLVTTHDLLLRYFGSTKAAFA